MREICTSGSEGGVAQTNAPSLPPIPTELKPLGTVYTSFLRVFPPSNESFFRLRFD
jgi:hypothetical protein